MGRFYTAQELSEHQSKTPEGYLLCESVPIARTGEQIYACTEVPIEPLPDGLIRIKREPEEVFRPETIASFEGKPVTLTHPDESVDPDTWREVACGAAQNVRRGTGIEDDYLFADLLITDAEAIAAVEKAKTSGSAMQISCGYDAEYEQLSPGVGRQTNIVGNHVALVERGRAGSRCAIKDEEFTMAKSTTKAPTQTWWDKMSKAVLGKDGKAAAALVKDADGPSGGDGDGDDDEDDKATKDEVNELKKTCDGLKKTVDGLPAVIAKAVKDAMEEKEDKDDKDTKDEVALAAEQAEKFDGGTVMTGDTLPALMSKVEILSPGFPVPTGDALKGKEKGLGTRIMRGALIRAMTDTKLAPRLAPVVAGLNLPTATHDVIGPVFAAAVEVARVHNNTEGRSVVPRTTKDFGHTTTADEMNRKAEAFWSKQKTA